MPELSNLPEFEEDDERLSNRIEIINVAGTPLRLVNLTEWVSYCGDIRYNIGENIDGALCLHRCDQIF
jgi:hypothetical protein